MKDFNLKFKKFFKGLNLRGGKLVFYNKHPYVVDVVFDSFYVEVTIIREFFFKENEFNVCVRDKTIEHYHPFIGFYNQRIITFNCPKSKLIDTMQQAIDFGYKRFIKLKIFL